MLTEVTAWLSRFCIMFSEFTDIDNSIPRIVFCIIANFSILIWSNFDCLIVQIFIQQGEEISESLLPHLNVTIYGG